MNPTADWTTLAEWMKDFRFLHSLARTGALDARDQARYDQDRDVLAKAMLIAQRLSIRPGNTPRQTLRVAAGLPVVLDGHGRREATKTLDLGFGGFATMIDKPMSVNQKYDFELTLAGTGPVKGRVRVVNVQRKGKPFRVAFAFDNLAAGESERVNLAVFDAALASIPD